jgi:PHD/YefM family antitoxin component YafN of YafNO toxin-antitoxin module
MKPLSAREPKYNLWGLIDTARVAPVVLEEHRRPVVAVLSIEEYERLKAIDSKKEAA